MKTIEERASRQLSALAEVSGLLEKAGIDYWLFGGWAVDFYVGSVTRPHDDIDLAVWLADVPQIAALLEDGGWHHAPFDDDDGGTGYERDDIRIELTYLVRSRSGIASISLRSGPVEWLGEEGLAGEVGEVGGVRSRLLGFTSLIDGKSTPRDDPDDAAKDRADFNQLLRRKTNGRNV